MGRMTLADILTGNGLVALGTGAAAGERDSFAGATLTVTGLLNLLAAQATDSAVANAAADHRAMIALLSEAVTDYPDTFTPPACAALHLSALEAANAEVAAAVIALHTRVEAAGDTARDRAILAFYRDSAARRQLVWPA
jgi:hypothetical protein